MLAERLHANGENTVPLAPVGVMLAAISGLAIVALLYHPVAHGNDAVAVMGSMRSQAMMDRIVHGSLAIIYGILTVGMFVFASRLGAWRLPVLLGLISFSCALVLIVLAAVTDGFIAPAIVERCPPSSAACTSQALVMLKFGALQIEYLTRFAFVGIAVAVLGWSLALISTYEAPRWSGIAGVAAGVAQLAALILSPERLTPHTLIFITAGQLSWYLIVATLMITGQRPFGAAANISR